MNKTLLKRPVLLLFAIILAWPLYGQFGNEWIQFNQQYFKIPVAKDGVYRLTYADLQGAGFPSNADYQRIQLFHRGVEQSINIVKANLGVSQLHPGDYIEFYGIKNSGVSDTELYKTGTQPHTYYNLYSDTTYYFLTVNSGLILGQRMDTYTEVNSLPAENFHADEKLQVYSTEYSSGIAYGSFTQNSFFETGEGWTGDQIVTNTFIDYQFENILNPATSSGSPQIEIQVTGRAEVIHRAEISVGPATPSRVIAIGDFANFNTLNITQTLNWSDIGADGKIVVRVRALGINNASDRLSVSYIKITYPQTFNQAGAAEKIFRLNPNASNKSYIEIQNTPVGLRLFDVTDSNNVLKIGTFNSPVFNAIVPNTATTRKILATTLFTVPEIKKVSFRNFDPAAADYIIISHPALMKPGGTYVDPVKAYAAYRASVEGGSYDTLIAKMPQLYDQFNYGEVSAMAIHRFMRFLLNGGSPRYLFIIGKGLDLNQDMGLKMGGYHRNPSAFTFHDYVPSAGIPASDVLFTAGLNGTTFEQAVPTGRITASTPADVAAYLEKVIETEALPYNDLWRKQLLHLSGGIDIQNNEPEIFAGYLKEFAGIAEDLYLGGKVSSISKTKTEIEFININTQVNAGVNLVTLFGHSSPTQNDVNIGFVSAPELEYNNPGKYPMFLINGCNAGEFLTTTTRYGEDWINTPAKGAIGFMANTFFGNSAVLKEYSQMFYQVAYGDSVFIHRGIGDIQKETFRRILLLFPTVGAITQGQQMFLLGDPAVKLFGASKPDYEINDNFVYAESFDENPITAASDSFAIKLIVRNFGRAKEDPVTIRVERVLSDNTTISFDTLFSPVLFRDTLTLKIFRSEKGFGNNVFHITVDPFNDINEITKENNTAEFSMFVPLSFARTLYPQRFSIVNSSSVSLVFQSTDVLGEARNFTVQVDTVDTFDSPFFQQFTVNGKIATLPVLLYTGADTLAYYWRIRFAQKLNEGESDDWSTSSFTYINNGPEGWAQVHFPQFLGDDFVGLVPDGNARLIRLEETVTNFSITTFGANHSGYVFDASLGKTYHPGLSVRIGGTEYHPVSLISLNPGIACRTNTINLIAFDKITTIPYVPIPVQFPDNRACGRRPEVITSFSSTQVESGDGKDLIQTIDNIQDADSVVLFSLGNFDYASWSANAKNKLAELGISSAQILALQPGEPVIIRAKKGAAIGMASIQKTSLVPADQQQLDGLGTITGTNLSGTMTSSLIGPAVAWGRLEMKSVKSEITDDYKVDVLGISLSGASTLLKPNQVISVVDLSDIDAAVFPYLQLVYHAEDESNQTPPQMKKWIVVYTPAPEGVITFSGNTDMQNLKEGEIWTGNYGFVNISEKSFADSLTVSYSTYNSTLRASRASTKKIKAPAPGEETAFDIVIDTKEIAGLNNLKVYVNPKVLPELYYDNNVIDLSRYLNVAPDVFAPVLDVTIDGRYVLNGDYVSSNPNIVAKLWDENSLLRKTDTLGITISLKYPCESCQATPIFFSRPDVQWQPATASTDFAFTFKPENLPVGTYTLTIIARDVRNNSSGKLPYEIMFNVSADNSIILQQPFPNPSTSIFNFTTVVTGDERPDLMTIEIINSTGQVVFNGTAANFITGTNRIQWEANTLPGGVYVYRMNVFRDGKKLKSKNGRIALVRDSR